MNQRKIAVLTANREHAKLLLRDPESGELKTILAIEDGPAPGAALNRRGDTHDERLRRQRVGAFIDVIAADFKVLAAREGLDGVVAAAPRRMLADLKAALGDATPVLGAIPKDLLKVPNHELTAILRGEMLQAGAAAPR